MFGKANRKEQALTLMGGNGLVLVHVVTTIRAGDIATLGALNALSVMGAVSVIGVCFAFVALTHATEDDREFEPFWFGAMVALVVSLLTLLVWFLNISEIVQQNIKQQTGG